MNICFRVDSSFNIGTGHVMRCLTLAKELKKNGHSIYFICRLHDGHLCNLIAGEDFKVFKLRKPTIFKPSYNLPKHASWLGISPKQDIQETINIVSSSQIKFDWIIIDHYAIDKVWEREIRKYIPRIMVIDDIADREHDCDILLDQNYYLHANNRYNNLVPAACILLLGPKYTLLRDEFIDMYKLPKIRKERKVALVFYGGSDPTNETLKALNAIKMIRSTPLLTHVVVGPSNPNKYLIKKQCEQYNFIFHFNINYMAKLIYEADFAICAGGSITWERYCLGTPAILTAIADNQIILCENINNLGIDQYLGVSELVTEHNMKDEIISFLKKNNLNDLSKISKNIVDLNGKSRVLNILNTIK
ncbi:UDP-2,4-diacetamido-2,4,6-trideoxy-beta-L-altropyranose hydrolase [Sporosarcina soli]|uniref:UDP-2,4-diacetamido-2,4, 6-trideoxy-beta-L-altropyranose hydrolase n=1 Tax=Sporosarcina soli TaxID=334736 RepID=A0ABW0TN16_9BACL